MLWTKKKLWIEDRAGLRTVFLSCEAGLTSGLWGLLYPHKLKKSSQKRNEKNCTHMLHKNTIPSFSLGNAASVVQEELMKIQILCEYKFKYDTSIMQMQSHLLLGGNGASATLYQQWHCTSNDTVLPAVQGVNEEGRMLAFLGLTMKKKYDTNTNTNTNIKSIQMRCSVGS